MTIYVDALRDNGWVLRGRRVQNCHMYTDGPVDELHAMADRIGMRRSWFQADDARLPHYDLTPSRRAAALLNGAVEATSRDVWEQMKRNRAKVSA
ncbi:MAG: DUF4031 domain-containing protein [Bacteroidota bacterium]